MTQDTDNSTRFGIGEWYGESFADMLPTDRLDFARFRPNKKVRLKKAERDRLDLLSTKEAAGESLSRKEAERLDDLRRKKQDEDAGNKRCRFKGLSTGAICTKDGGVCSLRVYENSKNGVTPLDGKRGSLRALCPYRFHEDNTVFNWASRVILSDEQPLLVGEVGFLESSETVDGSDGEDVGRIDMVLVKRHLPHNYPMQWSALEIQAVYFSGPEMEEEFKEIISRDGQLVFPTKVRRPDYRSSGPKRLMPQLQIKVPTLRRWGKKMAVVIDRAFFESMGTMATVDDISNGDIAWFLVDFKKTPGGSRFTLAEGEVVYTTLERAIEGLTGGTPVPLDKFEERIADKLKVSRNNVSVEPDLLTGLNPRPRS